MIYLTTGGNGAGKTLFTLKDVREQQLKENRPVYYHGFTPKPILDEWGWKPFDPKKWQELPDGSVCIFDECQNEFPAKIQGELPDYINAVAQFRRKRGFDFWMITPHPSMIHVNIRRLIESPSWHRHMLRTFGTDMVSELRFGYADMKCELPGAGKRGQVSMRAYPKEVYDWYESASLHTGKRRLPKQLWMFLGALAVVPVLGFFAYKNLMGSVLKDTSQTAKISTGAGLGGGASSYGSSQSQQMQPRMSVTEYLAVRTARVPDFPHTAPAYDEVTKPVAAPYPAACIYAHERKTCTCYTQQGTIMQTGGEVCMQIVKNGFFVDWNQPQQQVLPQLVKNDGQRVPAPVPNVVEMAKPKQPEQPRPQTWSEGLAARNAQVRSAFQ